MRYLFFFFNDTATTEIYTLSLHDALPICSLRRPGPPGDVACGGAGVPPRRPGHLSRSLRGVQPLLSRRSRADDARGQVRSRLITSRGESPDRGRPARSGPAPRRNTWPLPAPAEWRPAATRSEERRVGKECR